MASPGHPEAIALSTTDDWRSRAPDPVELIHQEHDTILIPPGTYEVRRQREYAPEGIRNVAD